MKKHLLSILLCFVPLSFLFAQESMEYFGILRINEETVLTYRIIFEENDGEISGYSFTDFGGDHETKSNVLGTYDKDKNELYFYESGIIYTKSSFLKNDFCFVHLVPANFKLGKTKAFKGDFEGKFKDGTKCVDGLVVLQAVERVEKLVNKITKKVNKSKKVDADLKEQFNSVNVMDSLKLNILKHGQKTSFFTKSNTVTLRIFDAAKVDNDITTIYLNDKVLLQSHVSTNEVKILKIPVANDMTEVKLYSESIGTIGLNTTIVEILDDDNEIQAMTNLKKDDSTIINIVKLK